MKTQRAEQHRAKTVRRFERGEPGLLQQAGHRQAETKADQLRRAKQEHGFASPWFGGQHAASLAQRRGSDDAKLFVAGFTLRHLHSRHIFCRMAAAHTNRLAREKSPYLLQHAHNPVDWFAWDDEAFEKARAENKPIFLSIGYSTCHWCHVMERESFEDEKVGAFLNEHFVSIKVDREERPDVDKIYMTFVQATTGGGGWPMNVFLTPDLKPFFGGTYFPPDNRSWPSEFSAIAPANRRALAGTPR